MVHNIVNTGDEAMKLFTAASLSEHPALAIDAAKPSRLTRF
jgi:hypothetical protein